jgi:chitin disaccharide deacetylase
LRVHKPSVSARLALERKTPVNDSFQPPFGRDSLPGTKWLVVNADDFGASSGVNRGIVEAHEHGIVTSASLMVRAAAAVEAADYARRRSQLGVGLHVELRHWRLRRLPWSHLRSEAALQAVAARDVAEQLEDFRRLVGRNPTHLDSHHHRHRIEPLRPIFLDLAQELGLPLRHFTPGIRFWGDFYGHDGKGRPKPQAITAEALIELLERLPVGVTELGSHPGYPNGLKAHYREERAHEIRTLCDERVRTAVDRLQITLVSFRELVGVGALSTTM